MRSFLAAVIAAAVFQTAHADSLQSVPETYNERYYIALSCDATLGLQASDAALAAAARFIVRYKPNLDCAKEYTPSLVARPKDVKKKD